MKGPTQRSLNLVRKDGFIAQVVEKWNAFAKVRQDLFNFGDIVAIKDSWPGVLAIQTTTQTNIGPRIEKITSNENAVIWLKAGNRIHVHGWRKLKKGLKRPTWVVDLRIAKLVKDQIIFDKIDPTTLEVL